MPVQLDRHAAPGPEGLEDAVAELEATVVGGEMRRRRTGRSRPFSQMWDAAGLVTRPPQAEEVGRPAEGEAGRPMTATAELAVRACGSGGCVPVGRRSAGPIPQR